MARGLSRKLRDAAQPRAEPMNFRTSRRGERSENIIVCQKGSDSYHRASCLQLNEIFVGQAGRNDEARRGQNEQYISFQRDFITET